MVKYFTLTHRILLTMVACLCILRHSSLLAADDALPENKDAYAAKMITDTTAAGLGGLLAGEPDRDKQIALIQTYIEPIRFFEDRSGYFYVYTYSHVCVAHAIQKDIIGTDLTQHQDTKGKFLIQELSATAKNGGGFVEFYWPKPDAPEGEYKKLGYVAPIPGTDFFIGTGLYMPE